MQRKTKEKSKRPLKTLERVFSKAGFGSRTDARKWIGSGRVGVNGKIVRNADHWVDLDTSGLLLLTNDTEFAERITNPEHKVPKTYQVKASTLLSDEQLEQLRKGVELSDGMTAPAEVRRLRDGAKYTFLEMTITEGRNRQVRRMVEAAGSKVLKLVRTAIGPIRIGELPIGKWRELTAEEVRALKRGDV